MRLYTHQRKFYCGIDLHTKKMFVCILDAGGNIRVHQNIKTDPEAFLRLIAPFRENIVVTVECMFTWYWIADLCAHIQNTRSQYNLPDPFGCIAKPQNREGITQRLDDPSVQKNMAVDLDVIETYDRILTQLERDIIASAKEHDLTSYALLQTIPGVGRILTLVILYEIESIERFPTVQDFVSYCRLVKCIKESNGKKYGSNG